VNAPSKLLSGMPSASRLAHELLTECVHAPRHCRVCLYHAIQADRDLWRTALETAAEDLDLLRAKLRAIAREASL
jgi:hypothetical protein